MEYQKLREEICQANKDIVSAGLVLLTWGNASGADREAGVMGIKPSGVDYHSLRPKDIVVLSIADGEILAGDLKPSSDTPTHLYLYQQFSKIGGVVHTHSTCATSFAQAQMPLPCYGTTHADHFYGAVPVARSLSKAEIAEDYEHNAGVSIVDTFNEQGLDPQQIPGVLLPGHAPFTWGENLAKAIENSMVLEEAAQIALHSLALCPDLYPLSASLLDKHFLRKHGDTAYYGQEKS